MTEARRAQSVHCGDCGGALEKGRPNCPYCGALIDLVDARLTAYCGECLAMSPDGAMFCCECGRKLGAQDAGVEETDSTCPRCQVRLRRREVGRHRAFECAMCYGLFVGVDDLELIVREQEERVSDPGAAGGPQRATLPGDPVAYLKCPVCGTSMNRLNYGRFSGVIIDFCRRHGYWLDAGELEKIARFVATGGLARKYEREVEELKMEKERLSSLPTFGEAPGAKYDLRDDSVFTGRGRGIGSFGDDITQIVDMISSLFRR
ncbi:MAG: zf-TFIIB domain-containing protein [Deltaproteobacteria bacterium]|nr:zf-TFIIB domain-containing protein [Deltaproteobacteria bacterium]